MQQPPGEQTSRSLRARRTQPALPGVALPTTPIAVPASQRQHWLQLSARQRPSSSALRRAASLLFTLGLLLGLCYWLLYPLVFQALPGSISAQFLTGAFPWLTRLFWTNRFPFLVSAFAHVSWLDLRSGSPNTAANLFLIVVGVAFVFLLLAARVCQRAMRERLPRGQARLLLVLLCFFTLLFSGLFVFLPGGFSQDMLLSGLYGRLIAVYHVNPYLASPGLLSHDPLYRLLPSGAFLSPLAGPLWLDLTVPVAWLAQANPVSVLLGFRVSGLFLQVVNTLLIWTILARVKPEVRLTGTLLYAWNPAILLLGVGEMHADMVVIFFLLLGALFLQRHSLLVSWICLLLAALINPFCLLLLPLFLRVFARETRILSRGRRALWWFGVLLFSALTVVLAYAPYWSGLGINGITLRLRQVFWQDTAQDSLLAALDKLPFASWPPAAWLLTSHHWLILLALTAGIVLLLGIWIADNLQLALLFGSWIFLALVILLPMSSPWLILLPLALSLASSNRGTSLLAHLLSAGSLVAYYLALWSSQWSGQALVTIGLPLLIWGWTLFFLSTWQMMHHEDDETVPAPQPRKRPGLSRPSWPSRPGLRKR